MTYLPYNIKYDIAYPLKYKENQVTSWNEANGGYVIGRVVKVYPRKCFVKINIFNFKFTLLGKAINFCIKYNIPISKIKEERVIMICKDQNTIFSGDY